MMFEVFIQNICHYWVDIMTKIPIFMYHHVANYSDETPLKSLFVSPKVFQAQMKMMHLLGYRGKSMAELLPFLKGERKGKVFGITFDDGYQDIYENALPVLKKYGFSSTCYVVSNEVGGFNRWDEKYQDEHPLMTFDGLKSWLECGQDIGVHTASHIDLSVLDPAHYQSEILASREVLQRQLNLSSLKHFCYPYGKFNDQVVHFLAESGFETATTTQRNLATSSDSLLKLPRVFMKNNMGMLKTFLKIKIG